MIDKTRERLRRAKRGRVKMAGKLRLSVHRTSRHIYVQLLSPEGQAMLAASTVDKAIRPQITQSGNKAAATVVGRVMAQRLIEKGIKQVAFDRSGNRYHGRIKALADALRSSGILL